MYATAIFNFNQANNGWLMAEFAVMRSMFLIFLFPPIISGGRRWLSKKQASAAKEPPSPGELPTNSGEFNATVGEQTVEEPVEPPKENDDRDGCEFDLIFLRWSLVVDGALTTVTAFATKSWHIYLGKPIVLCGRMAA